jgi:hypothetical protein
MEKVPKSGASVFAVIAACAFGIGVWAWLRSFGETTAFAGLRAESPLSSFGTLQAGQNFELPFTMQNGTAVSFQIIGYTNVCTPQGCLEVSGTPVTVPAHGSKALTVRGTTRGSGAFSGEVTLFTTCETNPEIRLNVVGRVFDAVH